MNILISKISLMQGVEQNHTMKVIDQRGKTVVPVPAPWLSMSEKLNNVMGEVTRGHLDTSRTIFVWLEEKEAKFLIENLKTLRVGQEFNPEAEPEEMKGMLRFISDPINNNHTNNVGRFIPTTAKMVSEGAEDIKTVYGWTYVARPSDMTLQDGTKVLFTF